VDAEGHLEGLQLGDAEVEWGDVGTRTEPSW
jgi:hypothetical protein